MVYIYISAYNNETILSNQYCRCFVKLPNIFYCGNTPVKLQTFTTIEIKKVVGIVCFTPTCIEATKECRKMSLRFSSSFYTNFTTSNKNYFVSNDKLFTCKEFVQFV